MTFFGKQLIPMIFQSTLFFNKAHGNLAKCFKFVGRKGNLHKSLTNNSPLFHTWEAMCLNSSHFKAALQ